MSAEKLLSRLQGVRQTGPARWMAKCPAHEDRGPSLSIRERDDGVILLYDFAGCEVESVVSAVGLTMPDLFPPPESAAKYRSASPSRIPATDALAAIDHEAHVVAVIAADVHEHREIDPPTWARLSQAVCRIGEARALVAPLKVKPTEMAS